MTHPHLLARSCRARLLPLILLGAGAAFSPTPGFAADPQPGGGHATQAQGAAAGGTSSEANSQIESCSETLGTISIDEQTNAGWYSAYQSQYKMGSTVPALRLIIQQSNCFVIVDRGRGLAARTREADLIRGEEGRAGSNYGKGQIAAADFTMIPEVTLSDRGGTRGGGGLGGLFGRSGAGAVLAGLAGSVSTNEAGAILTLVDNRSTVQLAAAEGYSKNVDIGLMGGSSAAAQPAARAPTQTRRRARSSSRRSPTPTTRWCGPCATTRHRPCAAASARAAGSASRAAARTPRAKCRSRRSSAMSRANAAHDNFTWREGRNDQAAWSARFPPGPAHPGGRPARRARRRCGRQLQPVPQVPGRSNLGSREERRQPRRCDARQQPVGRDPAIEHPTGRREDEVRSLAGGLQHDVPVAKARTQLDYDWKRGQLFAWDPSLKRLAYIRLSIDRQNGRLEGDFRNSDDHPGPLRDACEKADPAALPAPKF